MTFRVDLENFASAVERLLGVKVAAISTRDGRSILTAADAQKGLVVGCSSGKPASEIRESLTAKGLELISGEWSESGDFSLDSCDEQPSHIVAIAYKSRESTPGIWVDAFPHEPSNAEALKALFDEFESTGETAEVTFEEFVRLANPNVIVLSPEDVARFARARRREE
jgi:hypothetical protein